MKTFFWLLSTGSLLGSVAAVVLLVSLLRSPPGGPFIGGAGVVLGVAAAGLVVLLFVIGTVAAWQLRRHGDPLLLRIHLGWIGVLLVAAAASGLSALGRQAEVQRQSEQAWERSRQQEQALAAMLADPARLAAHVAQHGVHGAIGGTWMSPLEAALQQGHTDLALQMLGQGATVTDNALLLAKQRGDERLLAAMLARAKPGGVTGRMAQEDALQSAGARRDGP